jgi:organic radical activating enzyme
MLEVNEIFGPTIQGEGKLIGSPSIFIRFGKCNFKCVGFNVEYETPSGVKKCACDSYYAVDMEFKDSWKSYENSVDVVITGGEPLLYWNNQEFQNLIKHYINKNQRVTIETNGSLNIDFKEDYQKKIIFSMSVKLSNSLEPLKKRVNKSTLTKILQNTKESYLKFVIGDDFLENAINEIEDILKDIPKCEVYLMPLGDNSKTIDDNSKEVVNLSIKYGFKYSDRLHIRLWDNKRGV